jgi:hypothetical protein
MGSAADSLPMVDKNVIQRGPTLAQHHQDMLCSEVTTVEVKTALFAMDPSKALSIDGYNDHFSKHTWSI